MSYLQGPDISSWQGTANWNTVKASGRQFAWCKATEGVSYTNPYFVQNWTGMRTAGLIRGAYHFAQPDNDAAASEADYFIDTVGRIEPGDLLALDIEAGSGNLLDWALRFLERCTARVGFQPMVYSGNWFLGPHGVFGPDIAEYGLWLSGYSVSAPPLPAGWSALAMWQYTSSDQVPGIAGLVDESYFFGDETQLRSYGMPDPGQPSNPIPPDVRSQLVTIYSVIGDATYPEGVDMDSLMPNQPVSRRIFQRQLVQHGKALLGA